LVFEANRQLMIQPKSPRKRIGFMAKESRGAYGVKKNGRRRKINLHKGEEPGASGDKSAGFGQGKEWGEWGCVNDTGEDDVNRDFSPCFAGKKILYSVVNFRFFWSFSCCFMVSEIN
jgi:hypothetical protein